MNFFNCDISGFDTLEAEVKAECDKIQAKIPEALDEVGALMISKLQQHIKNDWYKHPFRPSIYQRRTDDPSLGTPLGSDDKDNMGYDPPTLTPDGAALHFYYTPTGEHKEEIWHTRDQDELISFLQMGNADMPPRPFWNNFVRDMEDSILPVLSEGMQPYLLTGDKTDSFDLSEFLLPQGASQMSVVGFTSDASDDILPF